MAKAPPGVYLLGMHRSGTSVLAGVLDLVGLAAGDRSDYLTADKFNTDGYWERRSVVNWHDDALRRVRGWASAPPSPVMLSDRRLAPLVDGIEPLLRDYNASWFLKDPRQCLFLPLWQQARGHRDLAVVVSRDPAKVQQSLINRNSYSPELAMALWERYTYDLLRGLSGRRALVVSYEQLTTHPAPIIDQIMAVLDDHVPGGVAALDTDIDAAIGLVRIRQHRPADTHGLGPEQRMLHTYLTDLLGYHDKLNIGQLALSGRTRDLLAKRRRRLNSGGWLARTNIDVRARLDRIRPQPRP